MKTNFTQGNWINGYGSGLTGPTTPACPNPTVDDGRDFIPISIRKETIAIVIQPENNSIEEMEANAKLIAAAPDMIHNLNESTSLLKLILSLDNIISKTLREAVESQIKRNELVIKKATE